MITNQSKLVDKMVHKKVTENAIYVKWKIGDEFYDFWCCSMLKYVIETYIPKKKN